MEQNQSNQLQINEPQYSISVNKISDFQENKNNELVEQKNENQKQQKHTRKNKQNHTKLIQDKEKLKNFNNQQTNFNFIPKSNRYKGKKMSLFELLYGDHYSSQNPIQRKWRKIFLTSLFVSMLYRAFETIQKLGAIRSHQHLMFIEQQKNEKANKNQKRCILYPEDKFKKVWNIIMIFILVTVGIFVPFRVCFIDEDYLTWVIIDYFYDTFFIIDLYVNFTSAYFDDDGRLVDEHKKIVMKYLTGWFIIDFAAIVPINLILQNDNSESSQSGGYNKLLRLLRLPRLYRLLRLLKLGKSGSDVKKKLFMARLLNFFHINEGFIKVLVLLVNILFLNHLVACFWHFLAKFEDFNEDTWVYRYDLQEKGRTERYVAAFYWSFQTLTTVGYGDIAPYTPLEQIYAMLWMFFGVGFFSYTLGNLSAIMGSIDKKTHEYNRKVNQFNDFAFKVKLPIEIRNKVHTYYQNNFYKNMYSNLDPNEMIQELPVTLQKDLLNYCYEFLKDEISLFQLDKNFTSRIVLHLYYLEAEKGDVIYREGDNPEEVYFLASGKVNLLSESGQTIVKMVEGCFFGEIEVIEDEPKREYFAVAEQSSSIYFIKKDIFQAILEDFSVIKKEIDEIIKRRKEKYKICQLLAQNQNQEEQQINSKGVLEKPQKLKKSTEHYLNLIIQFKEKALKKKKYKINLFQSKKSRQEKEEREKIEREAQMAELRKNLSSSQWQSNSAQLQSQQLEKKPVKSQFQQMSAASRLNKDNKQDQD